jgi:O-Antigen ligase
MLNHATYLLSALCALLPNWLAVALVPSLLVVQRLTITEEDALSVGPLHVYPLDVITALLVAKWLATVDWQDLLRRQSVVYSALGAWALVNLMASLVAGLKFGQSHMIGCIILWARGLSEAVLLLIMADALGSLRQARLVIAILVLFLGALVAIQFINFAGLDSGLVIGEVQGVERDAVRVFGPVGDSVGFVLLLGYLYWLCRENIIGVAAFVGGIVLTAGLGAIFGILVATAFYLFARRHIVAPGAAGRRGVQLLVGFLAVSVMAILYGESMTVTLRDRLSGQESGEQRQATAKIAFAMIEDNLFTGVGFMGFSAVADRYGAGDYFDPDKPDGGTANANNQVLQSLADAGIAGPLSLVLLIFTATRLFHRVAVRTRDPIVSVFFWAAMLWLLSQLFGNLAATWLTPASFVGIITWICIGLAVGVERLLTKTEETPLPATSEQVVALGAKELMSV